MAINLPANWANSTPKALFHIIALEGGQKELPVSLPLMGVGLAAYAAAMISLHRLEHDLGPSIGFGLACTALLVAANAGVMELYKRRDLTVQTITALSVTGVVIAITSIILHFILAFALPAPLPTHRLVNFLLFPIPMWNVFSFAYIYRHAGLRLLPAFRVRRLFRHHRLPHPDGADSLERFPTEWNHSVDKKSLQNQKAGANSDRKSLSAFSDFALGPLAALENRSDVAAD